MIGVEEAKSSIGQAVIYCRMYSSMKESGIISSANDKYVFVKFNNEEYGTACNPQDLRFPTEEENEYL